MSDKARKSSSFPKTLGQCIEPLTKPVFRSHGLAGTRFLTDWPQIVGDKLARHCVPQKISFPPGKTTDGTLTVAAESGFATEIQHMQPVILERMATYFGYRAVSRMTISHTLARPDAPAEAPQAPASLPKGSESLADAIEDDELKAALKSLAMSLSGETKKK